MKRYNVADILRAVFMFGGAVTGALWMLISDLRDKHLVSAGAMALGAFVGLAAGSLIFMLADKIVDP